ncbi:MAG: GNAT family N-acetyltransferase [Hyphomicrobiales bacterium]|nr:MAG: GNAT family N-acetyltransferase [Hyphomicrobiales bacterium]
MVCFEVEDREQHPDESQPVITARLILRTPQAADAAVLARLGNSPAIAKNLASMSYPFSTEQAAEWINAKSENQDGCFFVIVEQKSNMPIGTIGYGFRPDDPEPSLGYWIGEAYWANGYGTEASQAVITHAFETTKIEAMRAACRVINDRSHRVLEKCGFQYAGTGMIRSRYYNGMIPVDRFRLCRKTWVALTSWAVGRSGTPDRIEERTD